MKKTIVYVATVAMMLSLSSWSLKNLFGGASEATQTAATVTQTAATVTESANTVVNDATQTVSTDAKTSGQNAGKALSALYTLYKNNGNKLNFQDVSTYAQVALLTANTTCLKDNIKNSEFLKSYGQGLIAGGMGLVTENNVQNVTNTLTQMAQTAVSNAASSETAQQAASAISSTSSAINSTSSAINSIMSLFGSK